jgi:hypothetical protein
MIRIELVPCTEKCTHKESCAGKLFIDCSAHSLEDLRSAISEYKQLHMKKDPNCTDFRSISSPARGAANVIYVGGDRSL